MLRRRLMAKGELPLMLGKAQEQPAKGSASMLRRRLTAEGDLPRGLQEELRKAQGELAQGRANMPAERGFL